MDTQILPPFGYTSRAKGVSVTGNFGRMLRCSECLFTIRNQQRMTRHVAVEHIVYLPYVCPMSSCGESRYNRRELVEHICVKKHGDVTEFCYKDNVAKRRLLMEKLKQIFSIKHPEAEETTQHEGQIENERLNIDDSLDCHDNQFTGNITNLIGSSSKTLETTSNVKASMKNVKSEETMLVCAKDGTPSSGPRRKRHPVWLHYEPTEHPHTNRCRLCGKHIRGQFTTNVMAHLKHKHMELYQLLLRQHRRRDANDTPTDVGMTTPNSHQPTLNVDY